MTGKGLYRKARAAALGLVVAVATIVPVAPVAAGDDAPAEVWLISTRAAPRCTIRETPEARIGYWRLQDGCSWRRTDDEMFFRGTGEPMPVIVFVHGNRADASAAIRDGWYIYRRIRQEASGRPFRFVLWSWPADRIRGGPRRDAQVKAGYTNVQGYYLAECLDRLEDVPVTLVGYSFGARVITGALHLLGGGQLAGRQLCRQGDSQVPPIRRAVLVAAAADADWLWPGRRHGLALSQVDRMLITRNGRDPVLKWYPLMYRCGGPRAMGYAGPAGCGCLEQIETLNVTGTVGRNHDWARYAADPRLRRRLGWYCFLEPTE